VLSNGLKEHVGVQMQVAADGKMELVSDKHLGFEEEGGAAEYPDLPRYQWKNQPKEKIDKEIRKFQGEVGEITKFKNLNQERCISAQSDKDATLTFIDCDDNSDQLLWRLRKDGSYESLAHPNYCARQQGECDTTWASGARVRLGACPGFTTTSKGYGMILKMTQDRKCHLRTELRYSFGGPVHPSFQNNVYTTSGTTQWTDTANWGDVWERVESGAAGTPPAPPPPTPPPTPPPPTGTNYEAGKPNTLCAQDAQGQAIDSKGSCEKAAEALGLGKVEDIDHKTRPTGCNLKEGTVFFNVNAGGKAKKTIAPICMK